MPPKTHTIQESVASLDESFEASSIDQSEDRTDEQKEMQDSRDGNARNVLVNSPTIFNSLIL